MNQRSTKQGSLTAIIVTRLRRRRRERRGRGRGDGEGKGKVVAEPRAKLQLQNLVTAHIEDGFAI